MKIVLTGGGTGGHFYPLIAVAQEIRKKAEAEKLFDVELYYLSDTPYSTRVLYENKITFVPVAAGKRRLYFSLKNIFDPFKTALGILKAVRTVYSIYPDVVFSKGAYSSVPTVFAARILRIPVVVHESDSVPGRANSWAAKFAEKIIVSYPEAAKYFTKKEAIITGNPIRRELLAPITDGAYEFFHFKKDAPVLLVVGGSTGAEKINDTLLAILPSLVEKYNVIHQTGKNNIKDIETVAALKLEKSASKERYFPIDYLNETATRMAAGISSLVVTRAGSALFEIAAWGIPSIVIPITESNGNHQRSNAFSYARSGAGLVIEEGNLTPNILLSEIDRILASSELQAEMKKGAASFARPDAAQKVADEILKIALSHES